MASNELVGNIPTEELVSFLQKKKVSIKINSSKFEECYQLSSDFYNKYS